jgi:hypothetical protein
VSEPVVSLSEIVKYNPPAITSSRGQNDGGAGVGLRRDPGTVERVGNQE